MSNVIGFYEGTKTVNFRLWKGRERSEKILNKLVHCRRVIKFLGSKEENTVTFNLTGLENKCKNSITNPNNFYGILK